MDNNPQPQTQTPDALIDPQLLAISNTQAHVPANLVDAPPQGVIMDQDQNQEPTVAPSAAPASQVPDIMQGPLAQGGNVAVAQAAQPQIQQASAVAAPAPAPAAPGPSIFFPQNGNPLVGMQVPPQPQPPMQQAPPLAPLIAPPAPPAAPAAEADEAPDSPETSQASLRHPQFLPAMGVDPATLPAYPDWRPGWEKPYTKEEAQDFYRVPEEVAKKAKNAPNLTLNYRDHLRFQMDILERNIPYWDDATAAVGKQVLEMRDHAGLLGDPLIMDIKPTQRGQTQPFTASYLSKLISPIRGATRTQIINHCTSAFLTHSGHSDLRTWDKKHFEETLAAFYYTNGEDGRMYPIYPPKELMGLGVLPNGMGNPEDEDKGRVMVRNREEEVREWERWFEEFMQGGLEEEEEGEEFGEGEDGKGRDKDVMEVMEVMKVVQRKRKRGEELCLSF